MKINTYFFPFTKSWTEAKQIEPRTEADSESELNTEVDTSKGRKRNPKNRYSLSKIVSTKSKAHLQVEADSDSFHGGKRNTGQQYIPSNVITPACKSYQRIELDLELSQGRKRNPAQRYRQDNSVTRHESCYSLRVTCQKKVPQIILNSRFFR